ncbi:MAG: hypothetical protein ABJO29_13235 [Yoonia sp.]|uniref:hypothetical protein n=1 Tax=Yoonia sp. TaxID=2212373 RepID=UPI0032633A0B
MSDPKLRKLYSIYFRDWLLDIGNSNLLSLGETFDQRASEVVKFGRRIADFVSTIPEDVLCRLIDSSIGVETAVQRETVLQFDRELIELSKLAPVEIRIGKENDLVIIALGARPKAFADFSYWVKFDALTLDELVWLSTGLTPKTPDGEKELQKGARTRIFPLAEVAARKKLFLRAFPIAQGGPVSVAVFRDWARRVDLKYHPSFHDMLETAAQRVSDIENTSARATSSQSKSKIMQPREFRSAAKIITAMAVDLYGHVPGQKRSKSTKDIVDACLKAGLEVSNDTILKFLRAGDDLIDD